MSRKAIIFYCKDCGGWLFICRRDKQIIKDFKKEIIQYLSEGHKMEEINIDEDKVKAVNCECKTKQKGNVPIFNEEGYTNEEESQ